MTPAQRDAVVAEARGWVGTPYHHHARIKGVGVDCAQLLCAVYESAGVIPHVDPGFYPVEWHLHQSEELYEQWLAQYGEPIPLEAALPGDVAMFKFGRTFSHSSILVGGGLAIHAYLHREVLLSNINEEPLQGRLVKYWSIG